MNTIHYTIGVVLLTCALLCPPPAGAAGGYGDKESNGALSDTTKLQMPQKDKPGFDCNSVGTKKALPLKRQKAGRPRSPGKDRLFIPLLLFCSSRQHR